MISRLNFNKVNFFFTSLKRNIGNFKEIKAILVVSLKSIRRGIFFKNEMFANRIYFSKLKNLNS